MIGARIIKAPRPNSDYKKLCVSRRGSGWEGALGLTAMVSLGKSSAWTPDSLLTKCGNLAARPGLKHSLDATLGSSLANFLAEAALDAATGGFVPRCVLTVILVSLLATMQALKWIGHECHFNLQEDFQLIDEWLDLHSKHQIDLVTSKALN